MARILAVDDEEEVTALLSDFLTELGHQVRVAHSGSEALQKIEDDPPDLVILDIAMPKMDGVEVCRRIRADPDLASLPVLFLTARIGQEDKLSGFAAGADDYITKPFDTRELAARVGAILRRGRLATEAELLRVGELALNLDTFEVITPAKTVLLTPVEFDLLRYLMTNANQVVSIERLLRKVWHYPPGTGDPALVRRHIKNLRAKVEPTPAQPQYILTVSRHGYAVRSG